MFKNTASQSITLLVINTTTNLPATGDAANLTFYVKIDGGAVTALTASPTEDSSTNAPGLYTATLTQAETNGDKLSFSGKSSTSGVRVVPRAVDTTPANFSTLGISGSGHISTVTTLTNLPTIPTNWLTAAGLASDAVTEIQNGLATSANVTSAQSAITALLPDVLVNGGIKAYVQQIGTNAINATALDTSGGVSDFGTELYTSLAAAGMATSANVTSARDTITALLPAALVSGRLDVSVGAYQSGLTPLQPTVAGRTLDVSAGGEAGIDLANVGSPTTTLNLSGTTISTSQAVASVSSGVTVTTNNDKTGYSLAIAPPTANQISSQVAADLASAHGAGSWATATGFATTAEIGTATDRISYCLAILAGAISDAGTATETYTISIGGNTFTADYTGLDATGNRTATTLSKT